MNIITNKLKFIHIKDYIFNINEILFIEYDEYHCRLLVYLKNYNEVNIIYSISDEEFKRISNMLTRVCITTE